jgi:hypothetical protein
MFDGKQPLDIFSGFFFFFVTQVTISEDTM